MSDSNARFTLGYWGIRGLAQPIRLAIAYFGVPINDVRYNLKAITNEDGTKSFDPSEWTSVKGTLDLDFPNLPYFIDSENGLKLTQSLAIIKYVWEVCSGKPLAPNPVERAKLTLIEQEIVDALKRFTTLCYNQNFDSLKEGYLQNLPDFLTKLARFLADKTYLTGDEISYVDFMAFEYLDTQMIFAPGSLDDFPTLKDFHKRIAQLEKIKAYRQSESYIERPINNYVGKFY